MREELKKLIAEIVNESSEEYIEGITFNTIVIKAWRKAVAKSLIELIDEGEVIHNNNLYRKAVK